METSRAFIALSGGVDSTVAAYLTLQQGIPCVGGTLRLYDGDDATCGSTQDVLDAEDVAKKLGIGFHLIPAHQEFRRDVMDKFLRCYRTGTTPSPCIDCNRYMKFDHLLRWAMALGCDTLVTGHYAQIRRDPDTGRYLLYKAADLSKDQSYFLCMLTQHQLSHTRFPLGGLTKEQVRTIAEAQGFQNARKRDSQDICFIPDGDLRGFLCKEGVPSCPGDFLDLQGKTVGRHDGAIGYTLGQRKGLGLAMGQPVYVCATDVEKNTVTVGPNEALFHSSLIAHDWNWFPFPILTASMEVTAKVRSRMAEQAAVVHPLPDGSARVEFLEPQRAITPGQAVVLYQGDRVIGGGTVTKVQ